MASFLEDKERNVIPRWRDFRTTVAIGELKPAGEDTPTLETPENDPLVSKERDWKFHRTIPFAADLVGSAFVLGRQAEAVEAARFLLDQRDGVPELAKSLARQVLHPPTDTERIAASEELCEPEPKKIQERIHRLRLRLRGEPRNTVAYVDLARAYTLLDQKEQAARAMDMALKLAPDNRFVLRSAARFFIHAGKHDRAHDVLRRAEATKTDPWLLAAEIAVASAVDHTARFAKAGQRVLADDSHDPSEVTELASALATLEIEHGKARDARKLFRKALVSPTENSVAQVEWASRHIAGLDFVEVSEFNDVPRIYEARAWALFSARHWRESLREAWKWLYDQPFSSRPTGFGAYLASTVLGDYREAVKMLKRGLIANPNDPMLLNDLAFSYASLGQVKKARQEFEKINMASLQGEHLVVATATKGLLAFRSGRVAEGRANYLKAIEMAGQHRRKLRAMASIYHAREEMLARTVEALRAREVAAEEAQVVKDGILQEVFKRELRGNDEKASRGAS